MGLLLEIRKLIIKGLTKESKEEGEWKKWMEEEWMKFLNERGTQKTCKKMPLFADTYKHKHKQHIPTQHLYMCLHIQIESNPLHVVSTLHVYPDTVCLTLNWLY